MATKSPTVQVEAPSPSTGASTTPDGRCFLVLARIDESPGPQVIEVVGDEFRPYPDETWNSWSAGDGASQRLVRVNAQRVGPDGALWLVDVGAPGIGKSTVDDGPKLVQVDLRSDTVARTYPLAEALSTDSFVDDVRFNGKVAYITDAGDPGLVVLDLESGSTRRVLHHHWSTTAQRAITAEGIELRDDSDEPVFIHNDQLEVSPDGRYLYFQPCCGPMARVETRLLNDPNVPAVELEAAVEYFASTGSTGGTAIAADGTIYISNTDACRISAISPDGRLSTVMEDARLSWVDAMWIDSDGKLWMPAAQLHRMSTFHDGRDQVQPPIHVFTLQLDAHPAGERSCLRLRTETRRPEPG
ncbi:MAG: L-dopachrome tautomerase-related protein [Egibacteraceae bacterium]